MVPTSIHRLLLSLLLWFPLLGTGCKSCEPNVETKNSGSIQFFPQTIAFSQVADGSTSEVGATITNIGTSDLMIYSLELQPTSGAPPLQRIAIKDPPSLPLRIPPAESSFFSVTYTSKLGEPAENGSLKVGSSDPNYNTQPLTIPIYTTPNRSEMQVLPKPLRFARLSVGNRTTKTLSIRNNGSGVLLLTEPPQYAGGGDFKLRSINADGKPVSASDYPISINPANLHTGGAKEVTIDVEYAPLGQNKDNGTIEIYHKDPHDSSPQTETVSILATTSGPCILVRPLIRDLGPVPIGKLAKDQFTIINCGSEELEVSGITLQKNSAQNEFTLDLSASYDVTSAGLLKQPFKLQPNKSSKPIWFQYAPSGEGSDRADVVIDSNDSYQPKLTVALLGRGSTGACPIVDVGGYVEGQSVTPTPVVNASPLSYVILDGSKSKDPDGRIVDYEWTVVSKPLGGSNAIEPLKADSLNHDKSRRRYRPLVAGTYLIKLDVIDNEGFHSCSSKTVKLVVVPNEKIHIELTWTNPEDPDESDTIGSDVDLHMVKVGPGKWFVSPYDIYFKNPESDWNPEKPSLDLDDRDGGGPENIQLDNPLNCGWYAIGADYYKQMFGTAYITVRIYINQKLVYESANLPMTQTGNFWDIARIHWSGATATVLSVEKRLDSKPKNTSPEVTTDMQDSKYCSNSP